MQLVAPTTELTHSGVMSCDSMKKWRKENPEKNREYTREYYRVYRAAHPDKVRAWQKAHRSTEEFKARRRDQRRLRRESCPDEVRAEGREYYHRQERVPGRWTSRVLSAARGSCSRRGLGPVMIDRDYLLELWVKQEGRCFWTGVPMDVLRNSAWKVSIDRIDNARGYVPGNVNLASWIANRARGSLTFGAFGNAIAEMVPHLSKAPRLRVGQ